MTKEIIKSSDLTPLCESGFTSLKFSEKWKKTLLACICKLVYYMLQAHLDDYTKSVGTAFIAQLTTKSKNVRRIYIRAIHLLESFIGGVAYCLMVPRITYLFPGDIGVCCERFIEEESRAKRFSQSTVKNYTASLSHFSVAMEIRQVNLTNLGRQDVMMFISSVQNMNVHVYIPLRRFLKYLYDNKIIENDYSILLQDMKCIRGSKLPSVYTAEEIDRLEKSVERSSAVGKRNYAMLLLATRLGLRASDIVNLEFCNLEWESKKIRLIQAKTGHPIELPLLSDVGEGLIDYILHGRPQTALKKVFVTANNPVRPLKAANMWIIVTRLFLESGVDYDGRRHGGHAMRHSLATTILGNNVGLPVISGILGHTNTETTMVYLGVDIKTLIGCSLDVPTVDRSFYMQEGGVFYE